MKPNRVFVTDLNEIYCCVAGKFIVCFRIDFEAASENEKKVTCFFIEYK